MPGVVARILGGHDSISGFESAALRRYAEARSLRHHGYHYGAIYLFGYAVEMWIKAAYFRNEGARAPTATVTMGDMHNAWKNQLAAGVTMNRNLHDFAAWARLLIYIRNAIGPLPPYTPAMKLLIERHADAVRLHWDPVMRYRHLRLRRGELDSVVRSAAWFNKHYNVL